MSDEQFIKAFIDNYHRVFNYTGGQDPQLTMFLASTYTFSKKEFSGVILQKIIDEIEEKTKSSSVRLDLKMKYKLAIQFSQQNNMDETIQSFIKKDQLLKEVKFKNTPHRALAALFLQEDDREHAIRAKQLFDELNRQQRILTSNEDVPFVVYLSSDMNEQPKTQADTIVKYYNELRENHFTMGNSLQGLAQILTVYSSDYNEVLLQYVVQLREELLKRDIKVKRIHYPYLGVLALAATNESKVDAIVSLHHQFIEIKELKSNKSYALIIAIKKVIQDVLEIQELIEMTPLSDLTGLLDIADILVDLVGFLPPGLSDVVDFLN
ncbi:DUF4003 family protein [Ureibacillus sp. 179-F W5.1 NHS]|uniref:DUF4003 family protein n=1 Tax=unclassified Ureibacillus TaxID=2638520 RepID=UPI00311A052A